MFKYLFLPQCLAEVVEFLVDYDVPLDQHTVLALQRKIKEVELKLQYHYRRQDF